MKDDAGKRIRLEAVSKEASRVAGTIHGRLAR